MIREDRELLAELASLNTQLVTFAWGVLEDRLSFAEQHAVACRLVDLAEAIQARAQRQDTGVAGEVVEDGGMPAETRRATGLRPPPTGRRAARPNERSGPAGGGDEHHGGVR